MLTTHFPLSQTLSVRIFLSLKQCPKLMNFMDDSETSLRSTGHLIIRMSDFAERVPTAKIYTSDLLNFRITVIMISRLFLNLREESSMVIGNRMSRASKSADIHSPLSRGWMWRHMIGNLGLSVGSRYTTISLPSFKAHSRPTSIESIFDGSKTDELDIPELRKEDGYGAANGRQENSEC